jgi:hypothetical protein
MSTQKQVVRLSVERPIYQTYNSASARADASPG